MERFNPVTADQKLALRDKLMLPMDKSIVLHVGHVKRSRNVQTLLPLQALPSIQVVVLGSTTTEIDSSLLDRLVEAGMIVRTDYVPKIEEYYQAADCYVFPTLDPTAAIELPLSVLEAMSTNLPVVTTRFGGLTSFFASGNGYCFIERLTPSELCQTVSRVLSQDGVRTRDLVAHWSWPAVVSRLVRLYGELVSCARIEV
jgi:glycosyltransferase involved in cell wall biosynthesis